MLNEIRKRIRWYENVVIIVMAAFILEYVSCTCFAAPGADSKMSADGIVSKVIESYSGLPDFKVRVENHYGEKKDKPDEIIEATFKESKLVSTKIVKPKPSGISTSISPGLPVNILMETKSTSIIKLAGTKENDGAKYYILEAEQAPMKTVITVNSSNWTISKMELYMEGKKCMTNEFKYSKIRDYFLPVEAELTAAWGEKEEKVFSMYKDYRFDIELAETEE